MAFHINFDGEVGKCSAKTACPQELANAGKSVAPALSRETYFQEVEEKRERAARAQNEFDARTARMEKAWARNAQKQEEKEREQREERVKELRRMKTPTTKVPPEPEPGYFQTKHRPAIGSDLPNYGKILEVEERDSFISPSYLITYERPDGTRNRAELSKSMVNDVALMDEVQVWVEDYPDPELMRVHQAAVSERTMEDVVLNHMDMKSRAALRLANIGNLGHEREAREFLKTLREYRAKLKDFQKAGVSHPYTRALHAIDPTDTVRPTRHFELLSELLKGAAQGYSSSRSLRKEVLPYLYPKGKVPLMDYDPTDTWKEREEAGLV